MDINQFEKIKKFSEASGSIAVVDKNIEMRLNEYGIYEECLKDKNIKNIREDALLVSPNFNTQINEDDIAKSLYYDIEGIKYDKRIGYYLSNYVGSVKEGDYRKNASSGGMGTWILAELFKTGIIDGVIHVKENKENNNILFSYQISTSLEEILEGSKTKYYPVEISKVMEEVKNRPGKFAFIGIPSFVYSVRLLCHYDKTLREKIAFTIGLICGHQKSSKFAESMAWQMGISPNSLKEIDFRVKLNNEPSNVYGIKVKGEENGKEKVVIKRNIDLFGQNWGHGYFKPTCSDFTDDVFNETADIVLGDAWLEKYVTDNRGNNIVIVRNEFIDDLIKNAIKEGRLMMDNVDVSVIFSSQSSHYKHTREELSYRLFKEKQQNGFIPKKRVEPSDKSINKIRRKIQDLRKIISEASHIKYKEAIDKNEFNHYVSSMNPYLKKYNNIYTIIRLKNFTLKKLIKKIKNKIK